MKKSVKILTFAFALLAGTAGIATANGTAPPQPAQVTIPAPEPIGPPPPPPAPVATTYGPYVSGSAGVGFPDDTGLETGYLLNAALGYNFDPVRIEAAVGYQRHELEDLDDDVSYLSLMANAYYDFDAGSGVTPYVMAGAGIAEADESWTSDNDTGFAWQVGAGLGFPIGGGTTLDLGYRYFRPDDEDTEVELHNLQAGIRYQF